MYRLDFIDDCQTAAGCISFLWLMINGIKEIHMKALISADMKQINRKLVFDIVRKRKEVTRVELSEITGMSSPSILTIVNEFLQTGILVEQGKMSTTMGRHPMSLTFNPDVMFSIGIEFEGNNLSAGLVNLDGEIRFQTVSRIPSNLGDYFFDAVEKSIDKIEALLTKEGKSYYGIGMGIPGAVNNKTNVIYFAPYIGVNEPLDISPQIKRLEERFGKPIFVENDVNASAIGEFYVRQTGETYKDLLYISVGSGIGAGIILNKELRHGRNCLCGEVGYSLPDANEKVSRERTGWLEHKISHTTLCEMFPDYKNSYLVNEEMRIYISDTLCPYIANLTNALDLDLVVLGGELFINGGSKLLEVMHDTLNQLTLSDLQVKACITDYPGIVGTAMIASDNLFKTIL